MSFFGSLTGSTQRRDQRQGYEETVGILNKGRNEARGDLNSGFGSADRFLSQAQNAAGSGYDEAGQVLNQGETRANNLLNPYIEAGTDANSLYRNALGLNGQQAQEDFGRNYQANDPFRQSNANFSTDQIMRAMNARGMSGSGSAMEAVARQNLMQGSSDYNNYLNRLNGVRDSGQQAATNGAQFAGQYAGQRAGLGTGRGEASGNILSNRANNAQGRGNALANLNYGHAQTLGNQRMGLANATAASRTQGVNNILGGISSLGGIALNAFAPGASGVSAGGNIFKGLSGGGIR